MARTRKQRFGHCDLFYCFSCSEAWRHLVHQAKFQTKFSQLQWTLLNVITVGTSFCDNRNRLIALTEEMKTAILLYHEAKAARVPRQNLISNS